MPEESRALGWWSISGEALLGMLQRVADGEDPDLVYAEEYANCTVTDYGKEPDADAD